jgi:hypothetical protein
VVVVVVVRVKMASRYFLMYEQFLFVIGHLKIIKIS